MMNKLKTWFSKHKILTGVLAAGILAAIIFFVTRPSESASYSSTSLKPQDLRIYNSFVGTVQPNSDYRIIPKVSSLVTSVRVKEGDYVEKGQVIAVMDDTAAQYQIALKQAMMAQNGTSSYYNIKDAETAYQNYKTALENGLNSSLLSAGRSLDSAALSLDHAEDALESGLNSADAAVSAAARRVRDAKETVKVTKEALATSIAKTNVFRAIFLRGNKLSPLLRIITRCLLFFFKKIVVIIPNTTRRITKKPIPIIPSLLF